MPSADIGDGHAATGDVMSTGGSQSRVPCRRL